MPINKAALDQASAARKQYRANTPTTLYSVEGKDTVFIAAYLEAIKAPASEQAEIKLRSVGLTETKGECQEEAKELGVQVPGAAPTHQTDKSSDIGKAISLAAPFKFPTFGECDKLVQNWYYQGSSNNLTASCRLKNVAFMLQQYLLELREEIARPERESSEPMVPKWSLDSQIEISNALRKELEACQKRLLAKGEFEMMNTPVTNFNLQRLHPDIKPLTEEQRAELGFKDWLKTTTQHKSPQKKLKANWYGPRYNEATSGGQMNEEALQAAIAWYWRAGAISENIPRGCVREYLASLRKARPDWSLVIDEDYLYAVLYKPFCPRYNRHAREIVTKLGKHFRTLPTKQPGVRDSE